MLLRFDPFRDLDRATQLVTARPEAMPMDAYREGRPLRGALRPTRVSIPASIDLTVEKNVLTVRAERRLAAQLKNRRYWWPSDPGILQSAAVPG